MPKMSKFRKAFRLAEKAHQHFFRNGNHRESPKDDALEFMRETNYKIKNTRRKGHNLRMKIKLDK